ncbi:tyrosine-type recombinase/integrase [Mycoplasmopsis agalactiae]|nr:site-specific integrase [Mycoplasmopsis agalactiae]
MEIIRKIRSTSLEASSQDLYRRVYCLFLRYTNQMDKYKHTKLLKLKQRKIAFKPVIKKENIYNLTAFEYDERRSSIFYKLVIRFMFESGVRFGELESLQFNGTHLFVKGKGNKIRQILYNPETIKIIQHFNFDLTKSKRASLIKYIKQIFGQDYAAHSLRRSFATHMLKAGAMPKMVQLQMGHANIETTFHYLQIDEQESTQQYNRFMLASNA